jgi:cytochrome o ubiquinol oxidase operon protein cyoD
MSATQDIQEARQADAARGSLASYFIGFVLSLGLTVAAYLIVVNHALSGTWLPIALVTLGVLQLFVQLLFFLHLGRESRPRWNLIVLAFAVIVVGILVAGSLWIMSNLNYHMMSPAQTDQFIIKDEGVRE